MKKLVMILVLLVSLVACSSTENDTASTWSDELMSSDVIVVATSPDYPPYETIDEETGEITGFDIEMFEAIADMLGVEVQWQAMEFSTIVSAVQTGQVDLGVSGFSYDPEKQVLFSEPYYTSSQTILYLAEDGYTSIDDLSGKTVAAQLGTTCYDLLSSYEDIETVTGTDAAVLVEALRTGAYDGVCLDTPVAQNYCANDDSFAMLEPIAEDSYSIIASSDHELLIDKIDECLAEFLQTQEYTDLLAKWGI